LPKARGENTSLTRGASAQYFLTIFTNDSTRTILLWYLRLLLVAALSAVSAASINAAVGVPAATCQSCVANVNIPSTGVKASVVNNLDPTAPSYLSDTLVYAANLPSGRFPPDSILQNIAYPAWCIDTPTLPTFPSSHIVGPTSTYSATAMAYAASTGSPNAF
jgi:hypothetical protein